VNYFDSIRNWDKEKNKLLEAYGYSLTDDLKGKFEFAYKDGKPYLRVLDSSIKRIAPSVIGLQRKPVFESPVAVAEVEQEAAKPAEMQLALVFLENKQYPFIEVEGVQGEVNEERCP
jgi:non-specific serine/threonine protein kinase